jgi:acetylornithine deacetylase/succinyl-diaminopimelate desuccinylase family protein
MSELTSDQKTQVRELLATLVGIRSVNENPEHGNRVQSEREMSDFLEKHLHGMGMTVTRHTMSEGRDNLVAHWSDQTGERSFAYQAHMDTVRVSGMTIDPFAAEVRDERMWGRGTCDTKGSMAAYLTALDIARKNGWDFADKVHFVATCGEETGTMGAASLVANGFKVDAICVGEPTMSQVVTAHKGTYWARLSTKGLSCHASLPHLGKNAVYAMAKAIRFIEDDYLPRLSETRHPLLGQPTLSVGRIKGGVVTNIVPDSCYADLDFRILPSQSAHDVRDDFLARLARAVPDEEFTLNETHIQPPVESSPDHDFVRELLTIAGAHTGQTAPAGVNYYTDAGPFTTSGITCIIFGPGDIAQAHTAAEYLDLDQLYLATQINLAWLEREKKVSG